MEVLQNEATQRDDFLYQNIWCCCCLDVAEKSDEDNEDDDDDNKLCFVALKCIALERI